MKLRNLQQSCRELPSTKEKSIKSVKLLYRNVFGLDHKIVTIAVLMASELIRL